MKNRILKPTNICETGRTSLKSKYHTHPHSSPPAHESSVSDFTPEALEDISEATWPSVASLVLLKMNQFSWRWDYLKLNS